MDTEVNWYGFWARLLQVGEAQVWLGQLPLSRASDHMASLEMNVLELAKLRTVWASASEKISPCESFWPIMGVIPTVVPVRPRLVS